MAAEAVHSGSARWAHWLPIALSGVLIAGAVPLYAWRTAVWGGWVSYPGLSRTAFYPLPASVFLFHGVVYQPGFYYLGWYWAVALPAGCALVLGWYRWRAGRSGQAPPSLGYLVAVLVLAAAASALPVLTQAMPALSALWLWEPWAQGIPVLLISAAALGALARAAHRRGPAILAGCYAAAVLLTTGFLTLMPADDLLWRPSTTGPATFPAQVAILLVPAAVLLTAGLATFATHSQPGPT